MSDAGHLPRLLRGVSAGRRMTHEDHVREHGPLAVPDRASADGLVDEVELGGLRGRGGADFPTAVKLRAVRDARGGAIVVANGAEGEPCSVKDQVLLESTPHLVLDGAALAARIVGAREALVCVPEDNDAALRSVAAAIDERPREKGSAARLRLRPVPHRFIAGEESALVNHLNGGPIKPTLVPPRPYQRGVDRRPTLVSNVETLAHLALIARHGGDWFRALGTEAQPGSALITLSGAVGHEGVYEVSLGMRLVDLVETAGGLTGPIAGVLVGGYFGSWVAPAHLGEITFDDVGLRRLGAALGAGAVFLLPSDACGVSETARVLAFLSRESAGQCGPCTHGLAAIADAWWRVAAGRGDGRDVDRMVRWSAQVRGRGACHHPDGAVRLLGSALTAFAAEIELHTVEGSCSAPGNRGVLPIPAPPAEASAA
jgi:NADH:ubiquinone oxidoreductase subunit F (NADH-binding)